MIYATRKKDTRQHLLNEVDGPALCGEIGPWNARNGVFSNPVPGVPLCPQCAAVRNKVKKEAMQIAEAEEKARLLALIKHHWEKGMR